MLPVGRPTANNLYYRQGDKIYTVEARTDGSKPEFSAPKELCDIPQELDPIVLISDGKRIMATRPVGQHSESLLNLALNWQRLIQ